MATTVHWDALVADMLPGFELLSFRGHEEDGGRFHLAVEIVQVDGTAPIPADRECHILSELFRQVACVATLMDMADIEQQQPPMHVAITFLHE